MLGQRLALWLPALAARCCRIGGLGLDGILGIAGLELFELELELRDLPRDPLRRAAELHSAQLGDLELELLNLQRADLDRELGCLQLGLTSEREGAERFGIGGE